MGSAHWVCRRHAACPARAQASRKRRALSEFLLRAAELAKELGPAGVALYAATRPGPEGGGGGMRGEGVRAAVNLEPSASLRRGGGGGAPESECQALTGRLLRPGFLVIWDLECACMPHRGRPAAAMTRSRCG